MTTERDADRITSTARGSIPVETLVETSGGGLFSTGYFHDGPLIDRLEPDEQLHYLLSNLSKGLVVEKAEQTEQIDADSEYRTAALVTDQRIWFVVGQNGGDQTWTVTHGEVETVIPSTGFLKDRLTVTTGDAEYRMFVRTDENVEDVAAYLQQVDVDGEQTPSESASLSRPGVNELGDTQREQGEQETGSNDAPSIDETGLPSPVGIAGRSEDAATHIHRAREILDDASGSPEDTVQIRVHNRLCFALDAVDAGDDEGSIDQVCEILDQIEKELHEAQGAFGDERDEEHIGTP